MKFEELNENELFRIKGGEDNSVLRHLLMSPERHLPCGESQIQKAVSFQKGF